MRGAQPSASRTSRRRSLGNAAAASASYIYQPNGNLTSKIEGSSSVSLSYPAGNQPRPHAPTSVNGQSYGYDNNGNVTARPAQTLIYDEENRLTQVVSGGSTTNFTYDGDGNLVKKAAPEGTTLYAGAHYEVQPLPASPPPTLQPAGLPKRIFFPLLFNPYLSVDGRPAQVVKYYPVGSQRIASRTGSAGAVTYYYHDHLGSTIASSGGESTRYFPYGATRSGSVGTAYQFTGERREAGIGLYKMGGRWYDAGLGRFVQPDALIPQPGNPQALNRYAWVLNNPLKFVDPTGHGPNDPWHALGLYNPFEAIARYFGVPDFSLEGVPGYEDLTTDIDKTYVETFAAANQVIIPPTEAALNYAPGLSAAYQAATAASGATIFGQTLSPGERVVTGILGVVQMAPTGQLHPVFSNKIMDQLGKHEVLKGVFKRNSFLMQAADAISHKGYQEWHRAYDNEVVNWLADNPSASKKEFLEFLQGVYSRPEIQKRFPDAAILLKQALGE